MSCNIILRGSGSFRPGGTISGHVICTFDSIKRIRGITVKLRGGEHTSWTVSETYHDNETNETKHRYVIYSGDRQFVSVDIILLEERTLNPGRYEYPFNFGLPMNLPMNFRGSYGYVNYYIKATVDIPFAIDYEDIRNFQVYAPIDFNDIRSELQMDPRSYQDEKTICYFCCASGPITLDVRLPKEAFVLGEVMKIKIVVTNLSSKSIEGLRVKLKQIIVSRVNIPGARSKSETVLLAEISDTGVGRREERTYELGLQIPRSAAIHNFTGCTLFRQSFILKVELCLPVFHSNMEVQTGVTVGHVPLVVDENSPAPQSISSPSTAISIDAETPPPRYKQDDQPPTYLAANKAAKKTPPYSVGRIGLVSPSSSLMGFSMPVGILPVPVHGGAPSPTRSGSSGNAPQGNTAPSTHTQVVSHEGPSSGLSDAPPPSYDAPPPSYDDAVRASPGNLPTVHSPGPG